MKSLPENKFTWLYVFTFVLLLLYTFFSERGLIRVHQLATERDNIIMRSQIVEGENKKLLSKALLLKNDFKEMEKTARAELDLVREDEILYKFSK
ncbi:MAG: septum formation initiator family protein [Deltaproteobacteria bacterium]|nr:septum formation initiator family protein [Deltaproteobacteria bacterium]